MAHLVQQAVEDGIRRAEVLVPKPIVGEIGGVPSTYQPCAGGIVINGHRVACSVVGRGGDHIVGCESATVIVVSWPIPP